MKAIEVFKKIVAEKQGLAVRPTKGMLGEYDTKESLPPAGKPIRRKGWVLVDLFTASAVVQVHDALINGPGGWHDGSRLLASAKYRCEIHAEDHGTGAIKPYQKLERKVDGKGPLVGRKA